MDLCVPQEEGAEPKLLIDQLDEADSRIKGMLLDTANLAAAAVLSTVKYHDPSFDLQKVSEDVDLSGLVRREDIMPTAGEVVMKFDFGTDCSGAEMNIRHWLGQDAAVVNKLAI
jgi:hypothetical protein